MASYGCHKASPLSRGSLKLNGGWEPSGTSAVNTSDQNRQTKLSEHQSPTTKPANDNEIELEADDIAADSADNEGRETAEILKANEAESGDRPDLWSQVNALVAAVDHDAEEPCRPKTKKAAAGVQKQQQQQQQQSGATASDKLKQENEELKQEIERLQQENGELKRMLKTWQRRIKNIIKLLATSAARTYAYQKQNAALTAANAELTGAAMTPARDHNPRKRQRRETKGGSNGSAMDVDGDEALALSVGNSVPAPKA